MRRSTWSLRVRVRRGYCPCWVGSRAAVHQCSRPLGTRRWVVNPTAAVETWRHRACGGTTSSPPPSQSPIGTTVTSVGRARHQRWRQRRARRSGGACGRSRWRHGMRSGPGAGPRPPQPRRGEVAAWLTLVQALQRNIADLQGRQARLVRTLEERDYPGGTFFEQIAQRLGDLDREQQPNWPSCGPWSPNGRRPMRSRWSCWICPCSRPSGRLRRPNRCCAPMFERFQLQVRYHKPQKRATVRVALSDDSLDGLLASVGDLEGGAPRQGPAI